MLDFFETIDQFQIVLEYMEGKDLYEYLQVKTKSLKEEHVKNIAFQIGQGLQYLHTYGIIHRDLKLENIMMSDMSDDAVPKINDFGFAKVLAQKQRALDAYGTIGYVSPEILQH